MKEVVKVSISGIAFTFDQQAYRIVKEYLDKLEAGYEKKPDGREIVADIEARMAELILNEQESERVVGPRLAQEVVDQLGFPDDMDTREEPHVEKIPKRLHRNPDGALLGGVCSGLGAYFQVDPVWIRLAFFLPLLLVIVGGVFSANWSFQEFFASLFGMFILLYLLLWIAVPLARTPRQKLEMRGEKVTASSIHQTFNDDASAMSASSKHQRTASVWADLMCGIGRILLFALKTVVFLVALVLGIAALSILVAFVMLIFHAEAVGGEMVLESFSTLEGITPQWYAALIILAVLIPIIVLGYFLVKILFGAKTNKTFVLTTSIIWIILIVYLSVVTAYNGDNLREGARKVIHEIEYDRGRIDRIDLFSPQGDRNDDDELHEYIKEYLEDMSDTHNMQLNIKAQDGNVTITKTVVNPENQADTLSTEQIVISK